MSKNSAATVAHFAQQLAGKSQIATTATQQNAGIRRVGNTLVVAPYDTYAVGSSPIKKDGQLGKKRMLTMPFLHSYCPHCGEKYPTE